jgi:hypothetical protein
MMKNWNSSRRSENILSQFCSNHIYVVVTFHSVLSTRSLFSSAHRLANHAAAVDLSHQSMHHIQSIFIVMFMIIHHHLCGMFCIYKYYSNIVLFQLHVAVIVVCHRSITITITLDIIDCSKRKRLFQMNVHDRQCHTITIYWQALTVTIHRHV